MKATMPFLAAVVAAVGISVGAAFALQAFQKSVDEKFHTQGVRLDPSMGADRQSAAGRPVDAKPH